MLRKAAAAWSSLGSPGHTDLVSHIYNEKTVGETLSKLVSCNKEASQSLAKWSAGEDNATLRDLVTRMTELDEISNNLMKEYTEQYDSYRKIFKEILRGEKMVDDARKEVESQKAKVVKIAKQLETMQVRKKTDPTKKESMDLEYTKAIASHDEGVKELKMREENHGNFKYTKVREALYILARAGSSLFEQCSVIADAQEKLLQVYPKTMSKVTVETFNKAQQEGTKTIDEVATRLQIQRMPPTVEQAPEQATSQPGPATPPPKPKRVSDALVEATVPGAVHLDQSESVPTEDPYTYQPIPEREDDAYDNNPCVHESVTSEPSNGTSVPSDVEDRVKCQLSTNSPKDSPNTIRRPLPPIPISTNQGDLKVLNRQTSDADGDLYEATYAQLPQKTPPPRPPYTPSFKNKDGGPPGNETDRKLSESDASKTESAQETNDYLQLVSEDEDIRNIVADYDTPDSVLHHYKKQEEDSSNGSKVTAGKSKRRAAPSVPSTATEENKDTGL